MTRSTRMSSLALAFLALLVLSSCSGETDDDAQSVIRELQPPLTTEMSEETTSSGAAQYTPEETTSVTAERTEGLDPFRITLRLEGSAGVRFDGNCEFGGADRRVQGRVPGRVVVQTDGSELACGIRKLGDPGRLRVILTSDGRTRSVQQVGPGAGQVSVSYDPSRRGG